MYKDPDPIGKMEIPAKNYIRNLYHCLAKLLPLPQTVHTCV